jgi:hypothetical protein
MQGMRGRAVEPGRDRFPGRTGCIGSDGLSLESGPGIVTRSRRAELLHVLMLPDLERADRIGEFCGNPKTRTFAELLIACEEDRTLRAVLVGMLREADSGWVSE